MTSVQRAVEHFNPVLTAALFQCARPALPFTIHPRPHTLVTVPGSLAPFLGTGDSPPALPYPNPLAGGVAGAPAGGEASSGGKGGSELVPFNLPLWSSKVGGFGYLPKGYPYPRHAKHQTPLQLFVQFNLSELHAQCAAWGRTATGGDDGTDDFFPSPLRPRTGILALYTDPLDDCWGCSFQPRCPQEGHRVLYFPGDCEDAIYPALRGGGGTAAVEARLAGLMWTREEQHEVMRGLDAGPRPMGGLALPFAASAAEEALEAERRRYAEVCWLLPPGTETPTHTAGSGDGDGPVASGDIDLPLLRARLPRSATYNHLWYGNLTGQEYAVTADTARVALEAAEVRAFFASRPELAAALPRTRLPLMDPVNTVDFNQLVLYRALRGPRGRELLELITRATARMERRWPNSAGPPAPPGTDPEDEVALLFVPDSKYVTRPASAEAEEGPADDQEEEEDDDAVAEAAMDRLRPNFPYFTNQLGGYPSFTQDDPRGYAYSLHNGGYDRGTSEPAKKVGSETEMPQQRGMLVFPEKRTAPGSHARAEDYKEATSEGGVTVARRDPVDGAITADYCLFQIGESSNTLMIGDVGIANLFIDLEDLKARRFDKAWFTYDCC